MAFIKARWHGKENSLDQKKKLDVFIAGNDATAKTTVSQLVEDGGMRPIDAGPLSHARYLEALAFLVGEGLMRAGLSNVDEGLAAEV